MIVQECPEEKSSFVSRITFFWFNSMIWTGYKKPLTSDDMWSLSPKNKTSSVLKVFDRVWIPAVEREKEMALRKTSEGQPIVMEISLLSALIKTYWPGMMSVALIKLIASTLTFVNPLVLDRLINFMDPNSDEPYWRGYLYASLMFISPMFESIFNSQYEYRVNLIGMKVRACVISVIYKKVTIISIK